jgi:thiamine-monophosphate kinase
LQEFELIKEIFAPLARADRPAFGLQSDTAHWPAPAGETVILTKDMFVEGRHFFATTEAGQIAQKLLRVNLSDLAASGATPCGYLLGLALPDGMDRDWLIAFRDGLAADQEEFGIELWGGDTVSAPSLMLSLTAVGTVPEGSAISRFGARAGDALYVSGTIGDAALGFQCLAQELPANAHFIGRLLKPQPRLALGEALRGLATAAVDISDGLVADVGHLANASGVGAVIERAKVPLSTEANELVDKAAECWPAILSGGEDYELAFTLAPERTVKLDEVSLRAGVSLTWIGKITDSEEVIVLDEMDNPVQLERMGFVHFDDE